MSLPFMPCSKHCVDDGRFEALQSVLEYLVQHAVGSRHHHVELHFSCDEEGSKNESSGQCGRSVRHSRLTS